MFDSCYGELNGLCTGRSLHTMTEADIEVERAKAMNWQAFNEVLCRDPDYMTFCPIFLN